MTEILRESSAIHSDCPIELTKVRSEQRHFVVAPFVRDLPDLFTIRTSMDEWLRRRFHIMPSVLVLDPSHVDQFITMRSGLDDIDFVDTGYVFNCSSLQIDDGHAPGRCIDRTD